MEEVVKRLNDRVLHLEQQNDKLWEFAVKQLEVNVNLWQAQIRLSQLIVRGFRSLADANK